LHILRLRGRSQNARKHAYGEPTGKTFVEVVNLGKYLNK
jgi:hypothetical protein